MQAAKNLTNRREIDVQVDRWEGKAERNDSSNNNKKHINTTANVDKNISLTESTTLEQDIKYNAANKCKSQPKLQRANTKEQTVLLTTSTENKQKVAKQHFSPLKRNIMQLRLQDTLHFLHTVQQNLYLLEQHCKLQNEYYRKEESVQQELHKRQQEETCCKELEELESRHEQCQSDSGVNKVYREQKGNNKFDDSSNNNFAYDYGTNRFAVVDVASDSDNSKSANDEINECSNSATEEVVQYNQWDKCNVDEIMLEEQNKKNTTTREKSNTNLIVNLTQIHLSPSSLEYLLSVTGRQHVAKIKELCNKLSKAINIHQKYYRIKILQTSLERSYYTLLRKAAIHSFQSLQQEEEEEKEEEIHKSEKEELEECTPCKANVESREQENYPLDTRCTMEHNNSIAEKNASLETITTLEVKEDSDSIPICENAYEHDEYNNNNNNIKINECNSNALTSIRVAKPSRCEENNNIVINSLSENNDNSKQNKKHKEQKQLLQRQNKLIADSIDVKDSVHKTVKEISTSKAILVCVNNTHSTTIHPLEHIIDQRNYTFQTISENNTDSINSNINSGTSNKANRYPRTLTQVEVHYILSQCDKLKEIKENETNSTLQHYNKAQPENIEEENSVYAIYKNIGIQPLFTNNINYNNNSISCQDNSQTTIKDATERLHEHKLQKKQLQVMYYCRNVITTTLDDITFTLLQALFKEQRELKRKKPLQFKAHQRYVVGLNETLKFLRSGRIKCVILTADIEVETEEAMTDATNANNVDDNITEYNKEYNTINDENNVYNKEKENVSSDTCCNNYEITPLSAEAQAKISKEQQKAVDVTLPVSTNAKIAKASTTRKRFQSLRAALSELAALCAGKKKMMCASSNTNTKSNNTWNEDEENKLIQSRKQRRNAKQHHTNNITDKEDNTNAHSMECDTLSVDVKKDSKNNKSNNDTNLHSNVIASNNNNAAVIPCITCMSRQRLAYALFAKNSSIACVGVIKAEKNHELLKALMLYGHVLRECYAELMHKYNITTQEEES